MYSSSYKHRNTTLSAFEDAYAKEAFLKRSASADNKVGCTPYSENVCKNTEQCNLNEASDVKNDNCSDIVLPNEKTPYQSGKPKGISGLFSGMDGGDILLILLILFFLSDNDRENDGLIPILLSLVLLL